MRMMHLKFGEQQLSGNMKMWVNAKIADITRK